MRSFTKTYLLAFTIPFFLSCTKEASNDTTDERTAPLLEGMGSHHHSISTDVDQVQRFFDQGLILSYGFNHKEAERSFREAARLDSNCAMAYWGVALVLGPNINAPMDPEDAPTAYEALQKAIHLAPDVTKKEQAYIQPCPPATSLKPLMIEVR